MLASEVGAELFHVSAPAWMPCGAYRSTTRETIAVLASHVATHPKTLLFIDEIDKIYHLETPWMGYIRGEIFEVTDGRWPQGTKLPGIPDDVDEEDQALETAKALVDLTRKLQENVFILGAGTFQDFFDHRGVCKSVGFGARGEIPAQISAEEIARRLPRELVNRFNGSLVLLPELGEEHYRLIAREAIESLPAWLRAEFSVAVHRLLPMAIAAKKGVRFLEEALMEALVVAKPPREKPVIPPEALDPCGPM
jgi:hypothetical protein